MKQLIFLSFLFLSFFGLLFAEDTTPICLKGDVRFKAKVEKDKKVSAQLKSEANACFKYSMENSWLDSKIKLSLPLEKFYDHSVQLEIERLIIGFSLLDDEALSLEIGRRKFEDLFESKVQFKSYYNGIHLSHSHAMNLGRFFVHGGPHFVNAAENFYGFIAECGMKKILDSNATLKYSIIDWNSSSSQQKDLNFLVSQMTLGYEIPRVMLSTGNFAMFSDKVLLYAAVLKNHHQCHDSYGFYTGACFGKIEQAKDLMIDVNYQYLNSQCMPEFDRTGVEKGFQIKAVYALLDNFDVQAKLTTSKSGELSAIYKW